MVAATFYVVDLEGLPQGNAQQTGTENDISNSKTHSL